MTAPEPQKRSTAVGQRLAEVFGYPKESIPFLPQLYDSAKDFLEVQLLWLEDENRIDFKGLGRMYFYPNRPLRWRLRRTPRSEVTPFSNSHAQMTRTVQPA